MRTIYKYPVPVDGNPLSIPGLRKIVHVGQDPMGKATMWVEVDTDKPATLYHFGVIGTGHHIPDHSKHLGTFIDGPFVWHIYQFGVMAASGSIPEGDRE